MGAVGSGGGVAGARASRVAAPGVPLPAAPPTVVSRPVSASELRPPPGGGARRAPPSATGATGPRAGVSVHLRSSAASVWCDASSSAEEAVLPGIIATPAPATPEADAVPVLRREPARCSACGAFVSPQCRVASGGDAWTCAFCGAGNAADFRAFVGAGPEEAAAMFPELVQPCVEYRAAPARATAVAAAAQLPAVVLVVDGGIPSNELSSLRAAVADLLDRTPAEALLGIVVFDAVVRVYETGGGASGLLAADVLPGDRSVNDDDVTALAAHEREVPAGSAEYLAPRHVAAAAVLRVLDQLRGGPSVPRQDEDSGDADVDSSPGLGDADAQRRAADAARAARRERLRRRAEAARAAVPATRGAASRGEAADDATAEAARRRTAGLAAAAAAPRCVGAAVEVAAALVDAVQPLHKGAGEAARLTGRVVVFTSGAPNVGPGTVDAGGDIGGETTGASGAGARSAWFGGLPSAADDAVTVAATEYFARLGRATFASGVALDFFCGGRNGFGAAALHAAASPSGGSVLLHPCFGRALRANLLHTVLRGGRGEGIARSPATVRATVACVTLRVASPLAVSHFVGPVAPIDIARPFARCTALSPAVTGSREPPKEWVWTAPRGSSTLYCLTLARLDEAVSVAAFLGVAEAAGRAASPAPGSQLCVQLTLNTVDDAGNSMTRVDTVALDAAPDAAAVTASVDADALAVLLAKCAVTVANNAEEEDEGAGQGADAERDGRERGASFIDNYCRRLFSLASDSQKTKSGSLMASISPALQRILQRLYFTRVGPMLGPMLRDHDAMVALRAAFIRADSRSALRIMQPAVESLAFATDARGVVGIVVREAVPPTTLALRSDRWLLVDAGTQLFVWRGLTAEGGGAARTTLLREARQRAAERFPAAEVLSFSEGSPMARWLLCRLAPAHHDSEAEQLRDHPSLPPDAAAATRAKLPRSDTMSVNQYAAHVAR